MTADIIAIPPYDQRHKRNRKKLSDIRNVPLAYQPPALTRPGERWQINAYDLTQVIVLRDGDQHQRIVGRFLTARDAMAAAQSRAIAEDIIEAAQLTGEDNAELGHKVREILEAYGR